MTGEQALQIVELAILRVRDRQMAVFPRDEYLLNTLGGLSEEIQKLRDGVPGQCTKDAEK